MFFAFMELLLYGKILFFLSLLIKSYFIKGFEHQVSLFGLHLGKVIGSTSDERERKEQRLNI